MRLILAVAMVALLAALTPARASCVCRCVDGEVEPICSSSIDIPPICAPSICPIAPPSIAPIRPPVLAPLGTTECRQAQVLNPSTRRYEWRRVCD